MKWHYTLPYSSVPPTLFQDPSSWGDLSSFEFFEDKDTWANKAPSSKVAQLQQRGASACRPQGHPVTTLSKITSSQSSPGSPKYLSASQGSAAPWVLVRKRRGDSSPLASGHGSAFVLADASSSTPPKRSPVKSLLFSPSQVDQDFCTDVTNSQKSPQP